MVDFFFGSIFITGNHVKRLGFEMIITVILIAQKNIQHMELLS